MRQRTCAIATLAALGLTALANSASAFNVGEQDEFLSALKSLGLRDIDLTATGAPEQRSYKDGVLKLSTGNVNLLDDGTVPYNSQPISLTPTGQYLGRNTYDTVSATLSFAVDTETTLYFSSVWETEEFPNYTELFFDRSRILANGVNIAVIDGCELSVQCFETRPGLLDWKAGPFVQGFDAVGQFDFEHTFQPGEHKLSWINDDVGDAFLNTQWSVLLTSFSDTPVVREPEVPTEPVPEPASLLGLLALGGVGALTRRFAA
jgi:hypothetical protein